MNRWIVRLAFCLICLLALPRNTPAPLIYRAGEGWTYEPVGGGKWQRSRAKDQLEVAQAAFDKKDYSVALKAARRTVKVWPLSDYAPQAQYLFGRCYEAKGQDEKAFREYQKVLEKYPKIDNADEILQRQYAIANRFLAGQWFKLWGYIPFFPSMDKTSLMYEKLIKNGPYSEVAPPGANEYRRRPGKAVGFPRGSQSLRKGRRPLPRLQKCGGGCALQSRRGLQQTGQNGRDDQNVAGQAIATFTDFMTLYPQDPRVPEAQKIIASLKTEQARGSFAIAQFYEKKKRWDGALVYYNEVLIKDSNSKYAEEAKRRIEAIKKQPAQQTVQK